MKLMLAIATLFSLNLAFADVTAGGHVFYVTPTSGDLVYRNVSITVPSRGQGDVTLTMPGLTATADRFFTVESKGRKVFYVVFTGLPFMGDDEQLVFRGTYQRGNNEAIYYGDSFKVSPSADIVKAMERGDASHSGGFFFRAVID